MERGVLVPIRCIRVKTNIDLTDVRINGIKYNSQDLESKLFIPERNQLIVDTYLKYVNGKKTVIFCASVDHAAEIAKLLRDNGVKAEAVSGRDRVEIREKILKDYETGSTNVLCVCDLLNEGWNCPHTTVLLKAIYEYMDSSGRVALPDVVDYFIDFYEDRKAHGMIAEKSTSIYQKGGYTRKDVETIEVNPIIFRKLTREDWLHIVDVCDKSLEKYYLRIKK